MTLAEAHARLRDMGLPAFGTRAAAARLRVEPAHASQLLARLQRTGHVARLKHGLWALPEGMDRLALPAYLTAPFPSYVSLQSALYYHGMISQVPALVYAVSLARARRYRTPLGAVSVHHVQPGFFFGFIETGVLQARIATPEKALVDLLYLSPARSGLFRSLPEIELGRGFSAARARAMVARIPAGGRREAAAQRLQRLLAV